MRGITPRILALLAVLAGWNVPALPQSHAGFDVVRSLPGLTRAVESRERPDSSIRPPAVALALVPRLTPLLFAFVFGVNLLLGFRFGEILYRRLGNKLLGLSAAAPRTDRR